MKQFLRYQISGMVFIMWGVVFFYGRDTNDLFELICLLVPVFGNIKIVAGLVAIALPIGVLIHQFSVVIKNYIVGVVFKEFSDSPEKEIIIQLDSKSKEKSTEYCLERISNLNSFYYVRFDNGLLSPFLAWWSVYYFMDGNINLIWIKSACFIGFLTTVIYFPKIFLEMKAYIDILKYIPINKMKGMEKLPNDNKDKDKDNTSFLKTVSQIELSCLTLFIIIIVVIIVYFLHYDTGGIGAIILGCLIGVIGVIGVITYNFFKNYKLPILFVLLVCSFYFSWGVKITGNQKYIINSNKNTPPAYHCTPCKIN